MPPIENQTQSAENIAPQTPVNQTRLIILTVVMILLGLLVDTYFIFQNKSPVPSVVQNQIILTSATTTTDQFVGWKTYRNEKNGFSISYPNSWFIQGTDVEPWVIQSTDFPNNVHGIGLPPIGDMRINIANEPCKDYSTDFVNEKDNFQIDISEKTTCINNFQVTLDLWNKDPNFDQHKKLLDQILSTFKFISISVPITNTSNSGISGTVTIGPTCPVERIPPDPQCADKPYQAGFNVKNQSGQVIKSFSSDVDGKFFVDLAPGIYTVTSVGNLGTMPRALQQTAEVAKGKYTQMDFQFDSGIR